MREGNAVGDGKRGHIEQAMHQHKSEEGPEERVGLLACGVVCQLRGIHGRIGLQEEKSDHRRTADEVTEGHEFFGGKFPIHKLIAEKHRHNRTQREGIENPRLLGVGESKARQVSKDQRQPRAPDGDFQDHHDEQFVADGGIHNSGRG